MKAFQQEVDEWVRELGTDETMDVRSRSHRFTEEALELAQATGTTREEITELADYVYGREVGEVSEEVGGTMLTLAALCTSLTLSLKECAQSIMPYAWANIGRIKDKRASAAKQGALPGVSNIQKVEHGTVAKSTKIVDALEAEHAKDELLRHLFDYVATQVPEIDDEGDEPTVECVCCKAWSSLPRNKSINEVLVHRPTCVYKMAHDYHEKHGEPK